VAIEGALLAQCQLRIEEASERSPRMEHVERAGRAYVDALEVLVPMVRTAAVYYDRREFERDAFRYGRKAHAGLVAAFERARATEHELAITVIGHRRAWGRLELGVIEREDGRTALWHMRNVALRCASWVASAVSRGDSEATTLARGAFLEALSGADDYAAAHEEELAGLTGASQYMRGLTSLRQIATKRRLSPADRSELLVWHNQSIALFNRIVVTR